MIISNSRNFIFLHLEKTGGTAIEEALTPYLKHNDWICGGWTFGMEIWRLYSKQYKSDFLDNGLWKHASPDQIKKHIGKDKYDSMYKFATVRDPIKIMHSSYFFHKNFCDANIKMFNAQNFNNVIYDKFSDSEFKYINNTIISDDEYQVFYYETLLEKTGIDGWIKKMIESNHKSATSQIDRLGEDVDIYDISDIDNNWNKIVQKIGIDKNIILEKINVNSSKPKEIILEDKTIDLIKHQFKKDYETIPSITGVQWK